MSADANEKMFVARKYANQMQSTVAGAGAAVAGAATAGAAGAGAATNGVDTSHCGGSPHTMVCAVLDHEIKAKRIELADLRGKLQGTHH